MAIQRYPKIAIVKVMALKGIEKSGYSNLSSIFRFLWPKTINVTLSFRATVKGMFENSYPPPATV
jgi:hypothetical protein